LQNLAAGQGNLCVIEIKPAGSARDRIETDLRKLMAFRSMEDGYAATLLLVFGDEIQPVIGYGRDFRQAGLDINRV